MGCRCPSNPSSSNRSPTFPRPSGESPRRSRSPSAGVANPAVGQRTVADLVLSSGCHRLHQRQAARRGHHRPALSAQSGDRAERSMAEAVSAAGLRCLPFRMSTSERQALALWKWPSTCPTTTNREARFSPGPNRLSPEVSAIADAAAPPGRRQAAASAGRIPASDRRCPYANPARPQCQAAKTGGLSR